MAKGRKRTKPATGSSDTSDVIDGWLWWKSANSQRSRAKEAYDTLAPVIRAELKSRMDRYAAGTTRQGDVKPLGKEILELRYSYRNNQYRLLLARWGRYGLVLDVFFKNQEKTDRATAVERLKSWRSDFGRGDQ